VHEDLSTVIAEVRLFGEAREKRHGGGLVSFKNEIICMYEKKPDTDGPLRRREGRKKYALLVHTCCIAPQDLRDLLVETHHWIYGIERSKRKEDVARTHF
jgi:hypothetical protein